jgi:hypothetical protein
MDLTETSLKEASSNAKKYENNLKVLSETFPHILDEFKKYYTFFNKNPENNEYQHLHSSVKSNIQNANSQLFIVTNEIQSNVDELNVLIKKLNTKINKEKVTNADLKMKLGILNDENDATGLMISNYKETYNIQYFTNVVIFFGIMIACFIIYKIFGPLTKINEAVLEPIKPLK